MESVINGVSFESPCPCQKCINKTKIYKWTHPACNAPITITSDLYVRCKTCKRKCVFQKYPFTCQEHGQKEFPSREGSIYAFNVMKNLSNDEITKGYISLIIENVQKQFKSTSNTKLSQNEIKFISKCPVKKCIDKNRVYHWRHPDPSCKGELSLTIEGNIHCLKCGILIPFVEWPFKCDDHQYYDYASPEGIIAAVELLKETSGQDKSTLFFETLAGNLLSSFMQSGNNKLKEIEFIAPCPCQECYGDNSVYHWKHQGCGGKLQLTSEGEIKCVRCRERKKFVDWPFNCVRHQNTKASTDGMQHCFQVINSVSLSESKQEFIATVTSKVINQFVNTQHIQQFDEIQFKAPCPVDQCKTKQEMVEWKHQNCGGILVINAQGHIRCKKCNKTSLFVKWPFNCGEHEDKLPSIQGTCNSLGKLSYEKCENKKQRHLSFNFPTQLNEQGYLFLIHLSQLIDLYKCLEQSVS